MAFPKPPPLKPKPDYPARISGIKRPHTASLIVGVSIAFWVLLLVIPVSLILLALSGWMGGVSGIWIAELGILLLAAWIGLSIGWRVGNAIVLVALRRTTRL